MPIKIEEKHGFRYHIIECDFCLEMIERDKDGVVAFVRDRETNGASVFTVCKRKRCARRFKSIIERATTLMPLAAFIVYLADTSDLNKRNREALTRKLEAAR